MRLQTFQKHLAIQYRVKNLGTPATYLGWTINLDVRRGHPCTPTNGYCQMNRASRTPRFQYTHLPSRQTPLLRPPLAIPCGFHSPRHYVRQLPTRALHFESDCTTFHPVQIYTSTPEEYPERWQNVPKHIKNMYLRNTRMPSMPITTIGSHLWLRPPLSSLSFILADQ